jgi:hypothetical protein
LVSSITSPLTGDGAEQIQDQVEISLSNYCVMTPTPVFFSALLMSMVTCSARLDLRLTAIQRVVANTITNNDTFNFINETMIHTN